MKLAPLGDRVLIRPKVRATKSDSGLLHLSEHAKPEQVGVVVALGPDAKIEGIGVGDTVLFSWQSGQELQMGDDRLLVMLEADLLCVIGPETAVEANELIL